MKKDFTDYFLHFKLNALVIGLIVLCLFPRTNLIAQSLNTLTLKQETDNQTHVTHEACKKIVLTTGYRFSSKSGKSMHAYIDPALVCDVHYGNQDGTSGETGDDPPFSNTFEVGTTAGEFAVSPTGGATYTIPLIVPPGTMGMVPHLSVSYNSQAGDGLLGIGWNLTGLSAISRTTQTLYHDNNISPVSLTNEDRFVLDGARLIATGTNDAGGSTYGTEAESFVRVNSIGQQGDGPNHFIVETKDGSTLEYGNSDDSRIEASGSNTALTWLLNKVTDVHGNYMKIYYTEDNGNGEFRPDYIEYTGNDKASPVLAPYNKVKFIYSERKDKQLAYVAGSQVKQSVLLTEVHTYDASGYQAHEYDFNYAYDMGSHLSAVVEKGSDGKQYNPIRIKWEKDYSTTPSIANYTITGLAGTLVPLDYNGDGFSDLTLFDNVNFYLFKNTFSNGSSWSVVGGGGLPDVGEKNAFGVPYENVSVDLDNNGLEDVLFQAIQVNKNFFSEDKVRLDFIPYYSKYDANSPLAAPLVLGTQIHFEEKTIGKEPGVKNIFGDFDGDGSSDVFMYFTDADKWIFYSFKTGQKYEHLVDWGNASDLFFYTVDINGDGKQEILLTSKRNNGYYEVHEITGNSTKIIGSGGYPTGYHDIYPGDFNGDGKTDLLTWSPIGWSIAYSTGTGFNEVSATFLANQGSPKKSKAYEYLVADFNGDGKADIVKKSANGHDGTYIDVYYSTGNDFIFARLFSSTLQFNSIGTSYVGDYNGDGHLDIIYKNGNTGSDYLITFLENKDIHKVKQITNGFDHNTKIEYNTLPLLAIQGSYSKGNKSVFPVIDFQKAIPVVSQSEQDDGIGTSNKITYSYSGAKIHLQGKGFLGFSGTIAVNQMANPLFTTSTYELDNFFQPLLSEKTSYLRSPEIVPISNQKYTYTTNDLTNKRYYTFLNTLIDNDQLHGNTSTSTYHQDEYGNTDSQTSSYKVLNTSNIVLSSSTTVNTPFIKAGAWIPSHPEKITTTTQRGNNPYTRFTDFTYNEFGQPATVKTDAGVLTDMSAPDSYDKFGNLLKSTISVPASPDIPSNTTTNVYDSKGRFVIRQTNALGHVASMIYDDAYGNVLKKTDPNQLTSQYIYDGFGRLKQTVTPSNQQINIARSWETGSGLANASFKVETTEAVMPSQTEHFDILGRTLQTQTTGFDGSKINVDNVYNGLGQLESQSEPYYNGTPLKTYYFYDDFQRVETVNAASGGVIKYTTTYGTNITSTVFTAIGVPTKTVTKTLDASGLLTSVNDAGGTLNYTYHSCGKPLTITIPGTNKKVQMEYDDFGRQISLNDPDAGLVTYTYDALSQLISQTDALNNTYTMTYDELGRVSTKIKEGTEASSIKYLYDDKLHGKGMLSNVTSLIGFSGIKADYTYDKFSRLQNKTETNIDGTSTPYSSSYLYDDLDRLIKETYPKNTNLPDSPNNPFSVKKSYNSNGYLETLSTGDDKPIWTCNAMTERGQVSSASSGNNLLTSTKRYSDLGYLEGNLIVKNTPTPSNPTGDMRYYFNPRTGNLEFLRNELHTLTETFKYDNLDRLTEVTLNGLNKLTTSYFASGNINSKTNVGDYNYGPPPHAVSTIQNPSSAVSLLQQDITYTTFNKVSTIVEGINEADVFYGPDLERKKMVIKNDNVILSTKYYIGNYEKTTTINQQPATNNYTRELHYISSPDGLCAIYVKNSLSPDEDSMYYIHTDHLGSIALISDKDGNVLEENSYDAWGRRRNATTWDFTGSFGSKYFDRGYTGHEHLPAFGLINMNGRMYDPLLGRMLSPDRYVQDASNSQNYNRYTYSNNNPLKYTDPDGDNPIIIAAAIIGGGMNVWSNWGNITKNPWSAFGYFASGAIGGAVSVANPFGGGSITAAGNVLVDVAFGNAPKLDNGKDILKYAGGKVLDGFGAAGSGQFAKSGFNLFTKWGWVQNAGMSGTTHLVDEGLGLAGGVMGPEFSITATQTPVGAYVGNAISAGRNVGKTVIGSYPDYINLANKIGANKFNIPPNIWANMTEAERWIANQKFLDRAILRGDEFILATPASKAVEGTYFWKELQYLFGK